jgi:hypothetical protein
LIGGAENEGVGEKPSKSRRGPSAKLSSKKKGQIPLKREKFLFLEAGVFS